MTENFKSRITTDLTELFSKGTVSAAKELTDSLNEGRTSADGNKFCSNGMPQYFTGTPNAKTVFVQLNPGIDIKKCEDDYRLFLKKYNITSSEMLIEESISYWKNFAHTLEKRDLFDVKCAFFLKSWEDSGITIDATLDDWNMREDKPEKIFAAQTEVIANKYQLELIPYASAQFKSPLKRDLKKLIPYLDGILEEIFSQDRKYIIFGSHLFSDLFKIYDKYHNVNNINIYEFWKEQGSIKWHCHIVTITYNGEEKMALIADTYPHRFLGVKAMEKYGKWCYKVWCEHVKFHPTNA